MVLEYWRGKFCEHIYSDIIWLSSLEVALYPVLWIWTYCTLYCRKEGFSGVSPKQAQTFCYLLRFHHLHEFLRSHLVDSYFLGFSRRTSNCPADGLQIRFPPGASWTHGKTAQVHRLCHMHSLGARLSDRPLRNAVVISNDCTTQCLLAIFWSNNILESSESRTIWVENANIRVLKTFHHQSRFCFLPKWRL